MYVGRLSASLGVCPYLPGPTWLVAFSARLVTFNIPDSWQTYCAVFCLPLAKDSHELWTEHCYYSQVNGVIFIAQ